MAEGQATSYWGLSAMAWGGERAADHGVPGQSSSTSPSRLRFLVCEFPDLLGITHPATHSLRFTAEQRQTLDTLHRLRFDEGRSAAAVRQAWSESRPGRRARVITVTSGKGGVGKTTVSVNLAVSLGQRGLRTLLVDADLGLGNVHVLAGVDGRRTLAELVPGGAPIEELLVDGPGAIKILCAGSGVARLADLDERTLNHLSSELNRLAPRFDVILLDTGAGISSHVVHFMRMAQDILVVTTPDLTAVLDAYGAIKVGREARVGGRFGILVNSVESPEEATRVFERISSCAQRFLQFSPASLGHLIRDDEVRKSNQLRRPIVLAQPAGAAARALLALADGLVKVERPERGNPPAEIAPAMFMNA